MRSIPCHIILIGLRGSGKSTVGRIVARRSGLSLVDLDDLAALRLGSTSAAAAIATHGLDRFRLAESAALADCLAPDAEPSVLALGGGTPTAPGAADRLRLAALGGSLVAYLHAAPGELRARLRETNPADRPSLTGRGTLDEIEDIYLQRDGLYRSLCTVLIETQGLSAEQVATALTENR